MGKEVMLSLSGCVTAQRSTIPDKTGLFIFKSRKYFTVYCPHSASKLEEALLLKLVVLGLPCWQNIKLMFVFLLYTEKDIMKSQGIKRNGFFTRLHYKVCNIFAIFYFPLNHYMSV